MNISKRFKQFSLILLGLMLVMTYLTQPAHASGKTARESDFIGTWVPEKGQGNGPVDMTVTEKGHPSGVSYSFHFGPPKSCRLNAVKASLKDNVISLVISETSGGSCDMLWKQNMSLELIDKDHIRAIIESSDVNVVLTKTTNN